MEVVTLQPKQFRQQTLWPTAAEPTHVAGGGTPIEMGTAPGDRRTVRDALGDHVEFQSRRSLPNGGSQTTWQSQHSLAKYGDRLAPQPQGPSAREQELDSGQRAMFMTPREIHSRYQPLDGDRHPASDNFWGDESYSGPSTGTPERILYDHEMEDDDALWERKLDEAQMPRDEYLMERGEVGTGTGTFLDRLGERSSYPQQPSGTNPSTSAYESWEHREEAYIDRKYEERMETSGESLYDSVWESGVKSPIRLGDTHGLLDKPMMVGGHHRLAAATDLNQDKLVPVLHHRDIWEAQSDPKTTKAYPYS